MDSCQRQGGSVIGVSNSNIFYNAVEYGGMDSCQRWGGSVIGVSNSKIFYSFWFLRCLGDSHVEVDAIINEADCQSKLQKHLRAQPHQVKGQSQ